MESNPLVQYRLPGRDGFSAVRKTNRTKTLPDGLSLNKRKDIMPIKRRTQNTKKI